MSAYSSGLMSSSSRAVTSPPATPSTNTSSDSLENILSYPLLGDDVFELAERLGHSPRGSFDLERQEILHRSNLRERMVRRQGSCLFPCKTGIVRTALHVEQGAILLWEVSKPVLQVAGYVVGFVAFLIAVAGVLAGLILGVSAVFKDGGGEEKQKGQNDVAATVLSVALSAANSSSSAAPTSATRR